jgi:hypothetical protein
VDAFAYIVTFVGLIPALAQPRVPGGPADLVQHRLGAAPGRVRRLLVRYCWETYHFPRGIAQTQTRRVRINGVEQDADIISVFELETLTDIELEFDSNGRRDVLYTNGSARVVPKMVRLRDGRELVPQNPNDPNFAPGKRVRWSAFGALSEEVITAAAPDLLLFLKSVTRGVTSRFGRPFADPPYGLVVTDSRISATAQRLALLVK